MARVRCVKQPVEWGLRVNVLFTVGYEYAAGGMAGVKSAAEPTGSIELVERKAERSLKGKSGDYCAAVLFDPSPYEVTFAAARDAVGRSMEGRGGPVLGLVPADARADRRVPRGHQRGAQRGGRGEESAGRPREVRRMGRDESRDSGRSAGR